MFEESEARTCLLEHRAELRNQCKETQAGTRLWKAELRYPTFIQDTKDHWRFLCRKKGDHRTTPRPLTWLPGSGWSGTPSAEGDEV